MSNEKTSFIHSILNRFKMVKKHHVKRVVLIVFAILWVFGLIDKLTDDTLTLKGTLYAKTYSTGKHDVTFSGHYSYSYNGIQRTKTVTFYESAWKELVVHSSTREFRVSEGEFHGVIRVLWGFGTSFLTCIGLFCLTCFYVGRWLFTDNNGDVYDFLK
jgi:hypothetical protein